MTQCYFDIETTGLDPENSKICSIQYQRLSTESGSPVEDLVILKEWECSERNLIIEFDKLFSSIWDFVPVGQDLLFDFNFLDVKKKKYLGKEYGFDRPFIDIKSILILKNHGLFKRYNQSIGKTGEGKKVPEWYKQRDYQRIEDYIRREAKNFIDAYVVLKEELPKILLPAEK